MRAIEHCGGRFNQPNRLFTVPVEAPPGEFSDMFMHSNGQVDVLHVRDIDAEDRIATTAKRRNRHIHS
ncbi:MAG: hypothetical protein HZB40_21720 [Rhodocyclales bacterium]|nr:hypothetical protein [Rhodocyclales bacterium]